MPILSIARNGVPSDGKRVRIISSVLLQRDITMFAIISCVGIKNMSILFWEYYHLYDFRKYRWERNSQQK